MTKTLLCCDWGTSSFRLRLVDISDYKIIAEFQSSEGVASMFASWQKEGLTDRFEFYASRLWASIQQLGEKSVIDIAGIPLIVSGMASSTIGMQEIPYAPLPFAIDGSGVSSRLINDFNGKGAPLVLVSGVRSDDDVMRGEEAQLIGLVSLDEISNGGEDCIYVFPGTHSKHMLVKQGKLVSFQTFMTGELFNILSEHSILKDSITTGQDLNDPVNRSAFIAGVEASGFSNLLNSLFTVRTNQLFSKYPREQNAFFLSGLLIGTELKQLVGISVPLVICSGKNLFDHYKFAAAALNLTENITFIEPALIDKATIAGQVQIFKASIN